MGTLEFGIGIGIVFKTFSFFGGIKFSIKKIWYRKSIGLGIKKIGTQKVLDSVLEKFCIKKSIGFGIKTFDLGNKVSDSVSFRFWVLSHTGPR